MLSDMEIAQKAKIKKIATVAKKLGLGASDLELYGNYKAKISSDVWERVKGKPDGKLVLVTATNPTPAGEGKTTTAIGLADAFDRMGRNVCLTLREPSLGPCFGMKGGAAGGGYAQVVPMEDINLHFTGDIHAVTTAHNLLAAIIDNHIFHGNELKINHNRIFWRRVLDLNDRFLRNVVIGLGGMKSGVPLETKFDISVASEIMAILCMSTNLGDLKERLGKMLVAFSSDNEPIYSNDLKVTGALALLLKDAIKPNLVQTLEGVPCIIHGGPFANIAHGCNSLIATKYALKLSDIVVTEAGFGADLGAEKFINIKCRLGGLKPSVVVIVASVKAMKWHGGVKKENISEPNVKAVQKGVANLEKHIENMQSFGVPIVVAVNNFPQDTPEEVQVIADLCAKKKVRFARSNVHAEGSVGGIEMAKAVEAAFNEPVDLKFTYELETGVKEKIQAIATKIYGAEKVKYTPKALNQIKDTERLGFGNLPICMAKTQYSLTDNPKKLGRPEKFKIHVQEVRISAAGFLIVLVGDILTMPGLPKVPAAENIDITPEGVISGLF